MIKITFLSSGNGGNLKFLHLIKSISNESNFELSVITDRKCGANQFAREKNLELRTISVKRDEQTELSKSINDLKPNLIFTTIHKVISPEVLQDHGNKMINLHYSLLPLYSGTIGMKGVELATQNQDDFLGVTSHRVTPELDGGPILIQSKFRNPRNFETSTNASFRIGCLQIWSFLKEVGGKQDYLINSSTNIMEDLEVVHSSPISNLPSFVDEHFWVRLSQI